jgi:hypothetical protein
MPTERELVPFFRLATSPVWPRPRVTSYPRAVSWSAMKSDVLNSEFRMLVQVAAGCDHLGHVVGKLDRHRSITIVLTDAQA